jgi:hypothetical protein
MSRTSQHQQYPSDDQLSKAIEHALDCLPKQHVSPHLETTTEQWVTALYDQRSPLLRPRDLTATVGTTILLAAWAINTPLVTTDVSRYQSAGASAVARRVTDVNDSIPVDGTVTHPGITAFAKRFVAELRLPDWIHTTLDARLGHRTQRPPADAPTSDPVLFAASKVIELGNEILDDRPDHLVSKYGPRTEPDPVVPPAALEPYIIGSVDRLARTLPATI